jgi:deoxyguanosine kinase
MIYIQAPIGVGKTELTKYLTKDLGTVGFYERVDDMPMLKEFYSQGAKSRDDMSFALQIAFLNYRYKQLREAIYLQENKGMRNTVFDSSLLSDSLMAFNLYKRGEFPEVMYNLYIDLNRNMVDNVAGHPFNGTPDLIVFLDAPFDLMLSRIASRGRKMETTDPSLKDYYHSVWETYQHWYKGYSQSVVLRLDMSHCDFVKSLKDRHAVLDTIENKLVELGDLTADEHTAIRQRREHEEASHIPGQIASDGSATDWAA